jgi:peptidoglycan/xylan/chitin deacetylase (PgdA/CDA1 family)
MIDLNSDALTITDFGHLPIVKHYANMIITNVETTQPAAALTFDDGPHPIYTPRLLHILQKHRVTATFFMVGEAAKKYPDIVRMVAKKGHVIGNHTWNHSNFWTKKSRLYRLKQIWACKRATAPYCSRLFRPPFGKLYPGIRIDSLFFGYKIILWNASAQDWSRQNSKEIGEKIINRIHPGCIFLLHDAIYNSKLKESERQLDREPMLAGIDKALTALNGMFHFLSVPMLLKTGHPINNWPLS